MNSFHERNRFDLIVVGGGVAGLLGALTAADDADVVLLAKGPPAGSNSWQAQGGVAAALAGATGRRSTPPTRCAPGGG